MTTQHAAAEPVAGTTVFVYEAPVRLWHWVNALCIVTLAITGYLIARPLGSLGGEASASFRMGYIRFVHFSAAYVLGVAFLVRIWWAFVGNEHARQMFLLPIATREWWAGLKHQSRWYLFLEPKSRRYVGHNPLGHIFMFVFSTLLMILMIASGFALYSEGKGLGSWQDSLFGWLIPLVGGSQAMHSWHHLGMWGIVCFVLLHVYTAIREEIMSRQSMLSAIVNGSRTFRE